MNILGISCFYHDSAAAVIKDGTLTAASQEERFNREKYSQAFPVNAINYCLQASGITIYDVDYIAFYEKPYLKFSRVIIDHILAYPFSIKSFVLGMPSWFDDKLALPLKAANDLGYEGKTLFVKHHLSHASSAFLVSPFQEAAIMTVDGVGEWATASCGTGSGNNISISKEIRYPDSLGLLYSMISTYLGFRVFSGEGKVMALASYGTPSYLDKFREMVSVRPDGSFKMKSKYLNLNKGEKMYSPHLEELFGKERNPGTALEKRHYDIASSLQKFIEDILIQMAEGLYHETKLDNLCLAGGVFLNCVVNSKLLTGTSFKNVFVQPAAGDSGAALGAAFYVYNSLLGNPRRFIMEHAYYGPEFTRDNIRRLLLSREIPFVELEEEALERYIAGKLADNRIVAWFQGKMEFGPRALGNRSILANPCSDGIRDILNFKIKKREFFRPFAPAVLEERASEYFTLKTKSPFMLLASDVIEEKKHLIPGVVHVDGSARVQTVGRETNPKFWGLIKEFEKLTGIPIVINTSFNLQDEPIVCTPEDALGSFLRSKMDCLVLGNMVIENPDKS